MHLAELSATIVVTGCGGGAGASILVAGLAVAAVRRQLTVAVLDLDRYGGGLDVVFGVERDDGVRWAQVAGSQGELDGTALLRALPSVAGAALLSHGRDGVLVPDHVRTASMVALSGVCDLVLVDACRGTDASEWPMDADFIVVAGGCVRAGAAAGAVVQALQSVGREPVVVLRDASDRFADEVTDALSVRVIAHLASERRVEADLSRGDLPGTRGELATVCDRLLDGLLLPTEAVA